MQGRPGLGAGRPPGRLGLLGQPGQRRVQQRDRSRQRRGRQGLPEPCRLAQTQGALREACCHRLGPGETQGAELPESPFQLTGTSAQQALHGRRGVRHPRAAQQPLGPGGQPRALAARQSLEQRVALPVRQPGHHRQGQAPQLLRPALVEQQLEQRVEGLDAAVRGQPGQLLGGRAPAAAGPWRVTVARAGATRGFARLASVSTARAASSGSASWQSGSSSSRARASREPSSTRSASRRAGAGTPGSQAARGSSTRARGGAAGPPRPPARPAGRRPAAPAARGSLAGAMVRSA